MLAAASSRSSVHGPGVPPDRRLRRAVTALSLAIAACSVGLAQQPGNADQPAAELGFGHDPRTENRLIVALAGLEEQVRLNDSLLRSALRDLQHAITQRNASLQIMLEEQNKADAFVRDVDSLTASALADRIESLDAARVGYRSRDDDVRLRLTEVRRYLDQREALSTRIADLRTRLPSDREQLTGVWEVRWFPAGVTGTFYIDQRGTLVTGQYRVRPTGSGSLQGTFVGGKLHLQRIDRQRGRDAELEGFLDPDGKQLKGTWQSFELVQGGIPHGQWIARRVE